jgi:signal transduction histidine kinase
MISLKRQLSWGLALSLVTLLTLQWVVVSYVINDLIEHQLATRLQREGENLLAGIEFDTSGTLLVDSQYVSAVYQRPFSGHYYVILANQDTHTSRSLWDDQISLKPLNKSEQTRTYVYGPEQQPLLVVAHGYQKQGNIVTIAVAENLAPVRTSMSRFQLLYAGISLLGLLTLLLIQRLIVLRALKPLQQVTDSIAQLISGEKSQIDNHGPAEISPLIEELNRIVKAVQSKSKRARESLGNLAHAIKTTLTLLNQVAEREEINQQPAIRNSIYAATASISQHIERELKKARMMGDIHPTQRIDLNKEVTQLIATLKQIYVAKELEITWQIAPNAQFDGDREDLLEMLGNLLDNACKWCENKVLLTINQTKTIDFIIEDDGPGCEEHTLDTLIQRGFRADESKPGSGLGLAITHDIVHSYGATLVFASSKRLGGLHVTVSFPRHTSQI